jgi:hypothetical protein
MITHDLLHVPFSNKKLTILNKLFKGSIIAIQIIRMKYYFYINVTKMWKMLMETMRIQSMQSFDFKLANLRNIGKLQFPFYKFGYFLANLNSLCKFTFKWENQRF